MEDSMLYIAIDFGTSFSGYAINFRNQEQIIIPSWGQNYGPKTFKTPTCILFDEGQQFLKFGYDAMMHYTQSMTTKQAKEHYLFEHFKMELYGKDIGRDLMITAKNGEKMSAMTVFSESLRYLKDHALEKLKENTSGKTFVASDVTWVLTIPAIWQAAAKQFMREAATQAELVTEDEPERLHVALEPEAASVHCMKLPSNGYIVENLGQESLEQKSGTQYMVVDCGGGTIDITVHEVENGGNLKELHAASGNDMGGQTVDREIISFLKDIFSVEIYDEFEKKYPGEALSLKYNIALSKSCKETVMIQCPFNLVKLASDGNNTTGKSMESYFEGVEGVQWGDGRIIITLGKLQSFFQKSLNAIKDSVNEILKKTELKIEYILLVGGFAECSILTEFMKEQFGSSHKILCPAEPQAAIIKGAIKYAKNPKVVQSRISVLTYGFSTCETFNENDHRGKSKYVNQNKEELCDVCFHTLVRAGESVNCDEVRTFTGFPVEVQQKEMTFPFYSSKKPKVLFTDEWGVDQIGSLTVKMPNTSRDMNRNVQLEVKFGSTEMQATAKDLDSNQVQSTKFDFMSQPS